LCPEVEHQLSIANHHQQQFGLESDLVLDPSHQFLAFDLEQGSRVCEGIRAELCAETLYGRTQSPDRNSLVAELCEQAGLDHLPPGHRITAGGLGAEDRGIVRAAAVVAVDPSTGCAMPQADQTIHVRVGVDRSV
jgi:hypothetical protein